VARSFPNLGFQVMVPRGKVMEAQRLLEEARAAGPEAAAAGELASEEQKVGARRPAAR